jgi:hypothetical protein
MRSTENLTNARPQGARALRLSAALDFGWVWIHTRIKHVMSAIAG